MKLRTALCMILAVVAAVLVAAPAVAAADGPATAPRVIFTEGFEGPPPSRLWLRAILPTPGDPQPAYWGPVTARKHAGTHGLWCAGTSTASTTNGWTYFAGLYPAFTGGIANFDVPELADYYSATLDYWYDMPSIGSSDRDSFNIMWQPSSGGIWDTHVGQPIASSFTHKTFSLTAPTPAGSFRPIDLSRTAGVVRFNFLDSVSDYEGSPSTGEGPTVDDVTVAGFKYGPVRDLAATTVGSSVKLTWTIPARSTALLAADEERPLTYRVWRSPDVVPYVWTEVSDARVSGTAFTDVAPLDGAARYVVQAWDADGGPGYGEVDVVNPVRALVVPPAPMTTLSVTGGSPDAAGVYASPPQIQLMRDSVRGTTSYRWDAGGFVLTSAQLVAVPSLNGTHTLEYYSANSLGTQEQHHTRVVVVKVADPGPAPVSTITVSGAKDSGGAFMTPTVTVSRDQAGGTTYYRIDGGSYVATAAASFRVTLPAGSHTLAAYAVSATGVQGAAATRSLVVKTRPSVGTPSISTSYVRHGRAFSIKGTLGPVHTSSTIVKLYIERYYSGHYHAYRTVTATVAAKATSYSYKLTLTRASTYRVRAYHADSVHAATYGSYRNFTVH